MIEFYLITGFLGSGKTTFLKDFIKGFPNKKIAIIVNEFGKVGVDGVLLSTVNATLSEINNGSIFCSCKIEEFEEELQKLLEIKPDIIITETSGLSDPTSINKIIKNNSLIEYAGSICLVDARNFLKVYETARVCKKQIAVSDIAVINKCDLVNNETVNLIKEIIISQKPNIKIFETTYGVSQPQWFQNIDITSNSAELSSLHTMDLTLRKHLVTVKESFSYYDFVKFLEMIIEDTYRIKGFVKLEGKNFLVDCVANIVKLEPFNDSKNLGEIVILSGNKMPIKQSLEQAASWYAKDIISIQ
ncbi:MAG: hypothetical protein K0S55_932 [Clostridia bacterium]|nr:hypothetical protein [Clostridia bacterium]